jgi:hypothetical protein
MQMLHQNMDHLYNNHIKQHDERQAKRKNNQVLIDTLLFHHNIRKKTLSAICT